MSYKWADNEAGEKSTLYMHKWRVPNPPPKSINVTVKFKGELELYDEAQCFGEYTSDFTPLGKFGFCHLKSSPFWGEVLFSVI
ncbi:hypothetical protein BR63_09420 [Thermanaerosceptrum fracticalcis]|uniref:Uncharacterized protein n=1 Tax=Thermanaerosceptrum fracticalcis TaxID=1712410 RepID=A0A7G6E357_THEFR|nr:hypothetical protein [Thermanaerosceptrum fracticalcis]QNB46511.1 hypothetical protein BR63_09420 [Thermanaerosceptrum fracticalcis]